MVLSDPLVSVLACCNMPLDPGREADTLRSHLGNHKSLQCDKGVHIEHEFRTSRTVTQQGMTCEHVKIGYVAAIPTTPSNQQRAASAGHFIWRSRLGMLPGELDTRTENMKFDPPYVLRLLSHLLV